MNTKSKGQDIHPSMLYGKILAKRRINNSIAMICENILINRVLHQVFILSAKQKTIIINPKNQSISFSLSRANTYIKPSKNPRIKNILQLNLSILSKGLKITK